MQPLLAGFWSDGTGARYATSSGLGSRSDSFEQSVFMTV
jgi:hypothetical protein